MPETPAICIWRFTSGNRRSWHLSADRTGCARLITRIDRLLKSRGPASETIAIAAATRAVLSVPNNPSGQRVRETASPERLTLTYQGSAGDPEAFAIDADGPIATMHTGRAPLETLREGVADMSRGQGDWSMGSSEAELWFWWRPEIELEYVHDCLVAIGVREHEMPGFGGTPRGEHQGLVMSIPYGMTYHERGHALARQYLKKDGSISMEDLIRFFYDFGSSPSKFEVVFILTIDRTKYLVRSSPEWGLAHFTGSAFHMLRIRAYFMLRELTVIIRY